MSFFLFAPSARSRRVVFQAPTTQGKIRRSGDDRNAQADCAVRHAGRDLPLRRAERGRGDRAHPGVERYAATVGAHVLLRPRAPGECVEGYVFSNSESERIVLTLTCF